MKPGRILICLLFAAFLSCGHDNKNAGITSVSERIRVPEGLQVYNSSLDKKEFQPETKSFRFKIFTTINVSCATCILKLEEWKKFEAEINNCTPVLLVPVCTSKDKFEMLKYLIESNKIQNIGFPLLLDSTGSFKKWNKQFEGDNSVLTDENNVVMLTGKPTETEKDYRLFLNKVCTFSTANTN